MATENLGLFGTADHGECGTPVFVAQREDHYYGAYWNGADGIEPNESDQDFERGSVEPIQTGFFCPHCCRYVREDELV